MTKKEIRMVLVGYRIMRNLMKLGLTEKQAALVIKRMLKD